MKRTPVSVVAGAAAAGVSGLNVMADEPGVDSAGGCSGVVVAGAATIGDGPVEVVSAAEGGGLAVELQPGLAKIRISAKRWMPTTMPKIFRIFIGGIG